jgi:hypothetical protein
MANPTVGTMSETRGGMTVDDEPGEADDSIPPLIENIQTRWLDFYIEFIELAGC